MTYLFIVESGCQSEDARLRIQREDVVAPIGEDGVGDLGVDAFVDVVGRNCAHESPAPRVFGDVERVRRLAEYRRVVVRVRYLASGGYQVGLYECQSKYYLDVEYRLRELFAIVGPDGELVLALDLAIDHVAKGEGPFGGVQVELSVTVARYDGVRDLGLGVEVRGS